MLQNFFLIKRITVGIIILLSAFLLPWWLVLLISAIGLLFFDNLYEVIVAGFILDALYGEIFNILGFSLVFVIISIVMFYLLGFFRKNLFIKNV